MSNEQVDGFMVEVNGVLFKVKLMTSRKEVKSVIVYQDSMGSDEPPEKVSLGKTIMTEAQQGKLNRILYVFDEIVTEKLGQTSAACHVIDTGQSPQVQSYPYRIASAWKEELHG